MATVTRIFPEAPPEIHLILTQREADLVRSLIGDLNANGHAENTETINRVWDALRPVTEYVYGHGLKTAAGLKAFGTS